MEKEAIPKEECIRDVKQECFHFANLYFHFAKVLIDEFGKRRGRALITEALTNFAVERGLRLRERAVELGLEPTPENFLKVTDIPRIAWESKQGFYCPYADIWNQKGDIGREVGFLYCKVNDSTLFETYNPEWKLIKFNKNLLLGDNCCDAIMKFKGKRQRP